MAGGAIVIITCRHGFYMFYPEDMDDRAYFEAATGFKLTECGGGLTFPALLEMGDVSIQGQPYGGLTANVNYCGEPEDVFRANGFVFDVSAQKLAVIGDVKKTLELYPQINGALIAVDELPQAGGVTHKYGRLLSFTGVARFNNRQFILRTYELQK